MPASHSGGFPPRPWICNTSGNSDSKEIPACSGSRRARTAAVTLRSSTALTKVKVSVQVSDPLGYSCRPLYGVWHKHLVVNYLKKQEKSESRKFFMAPACADL
jgi:hypothetical protein